jgi:hypothetical protein
VGAALAITSAVSVIAISSPASAATLDVGYTLEGCRPGTFDQNTITCLDGDYTTGNLGKSWNELDLVPFRVTLDNGGSTSESGSFVVAGDYKNGAGTATGWDVVSELTLNTANSDAGCPTVISGAQTITPSGQGVGGADQTIYRTITATIPAQSTCVYDYYMRLALGAHNFSGASLQGNLWAEDLTSAGVGQKRVSLPVNEIAPQQLTKDMTASQDSDHVWNITKSPTPATLSFADTCDPAASLQAPVAITVTWEKLPATPSGDIDVITNIYATNPAFRTITVSVTDDIRSGTTVLDTASANLVDVPANTAGFLLLTHQTTVPAGTTNLNDVATATYTDKVTGVPVPGNTTAVASAGVQTSGTVTNGTATINDVESITGAGLSYSVDSFTGASGAFDAGYVAGSPTTGSVSWTSDSQSDSGSVTFNKTVYATAGTSGTGSLSDTATLTGSDGFTTDADADVDLSTAALVDLTINKRRSPVSLEAQTFDFNVKDGSDLVVASPSITIPGGVGATTDVSTTVSGLLPGSYTVDELASGVYPAQSATATITLPSCSGSVSFANDVAPAGARVEKITVPSSGTTWSFTLSGPDVGVSGTETVSAIAGDGYVNFTSALNTDGATYTITEDAVLTGYDATGVAGDFGGDSARVNTNVGSRTCSFTLDMPSDTGGTFSCSFTNTQRGSITIVKNAIPDDPQDFQYVSDLLNFALDDDPGDATLSNTRTFNDVAPGVQHFVREVLPVSGWAFTSLSCSSTLGTSTITKPFLGNPASVAITLGPGDSVTCTFTNTKQGRLGLIKTVNGSAPTGSQAFTFQLRQGATPSQAGTILESQVANAANGGNVSFSTLLVPGQTYQFCEIIMPGWSSTLGTFVPDSFMPPDGVVPNPNVDNSIVCVNFTVSAGQTKVFTVDNTPPPGGRALTIGFWKNWSSCSGGNQKPVLNQTLASFPGGGVLIGDLFVNTCLEAVRILNKSTVNNAKKKSSDPAFNLAAQLLAAKLNVQAGAGTCGAALTAINAAQSHLDALNFNGITHDNISKSLANTLNSLATTLDRYNNNLLC